MCHASPSPEPSSGTFEHYQKKQTNASRRWRGYSHFQGESNAAVTDVKVKNTRVHCVAIRFIGKYIVSTIQKATTDVVCMWTGCRGKCSDSTQVTAVQITLVIWERYISFSSINITKFEEYIFWDIMSSSPTEVHGRFGRNLHPKYLHLKRKPSKYTKRTSSKRSIEDNHEKFNQDSGCPCRDSNRGSYE
jgi:hypothetical protein